MAIKPPAAAERRTVFTDSKPHRVLTALAQWAAKGKTVRLSIGQVYAIMYTPVRHDSGRVRQYAIPPEDSSSATHGANLSMQVGNMLTYGMLVREKGTGLPAIGRHREQYYYTPGPIGLADVDVNPFVHTARRST